MTMGSRAWRSMCLTALLAAAGCAAPPRPAFRSYSGAEAPDASLAIVIFEAGDQVRVDDQEIDGMKYGSVELLPGPHEISWTHTFLVSVTVEASGRAIFDVGPAAVNLDAGHSYRLVSHRTVGRGYRVHFRIEEASSGLAIWTSR
jgi:hypothetical protein